MATLYTSVLVNSLPFLSSWGGLLISCATWMCLGLLSGHSPAVSLRVAHRALIRIVARTTYAIEPNKKCLAFLIRHLPAPKYGVAHLICCWLQRNTHWDNYRYASFQANHSGEHIVWCADWSEDWLVLHGLFYSK